jgi:hypothetical protein
MRAFNKKTVVGLAAGAVLLAGGGTALAYWTATGAGTGSAATSAGASDLTVTQTSTVTNMFPGDAPQSIAGSVANNAQYTAYVNQVVVSISGVTKATGVSGTCDASDYSLVNPTMSVAKEIKGGASAAFTGATIQFNDKANTNQDACKGATVALSYAVS